MFALAKRVLLQLKNDKRSIALLLFGPLLILSLIYFVFMAAFNNDTEYTIITQNAPQAFITSLEMQDDTKTYEVDDYAKELENEPDVDAAVVFSDNKVDIIYNYSNVFTNAEVGSRINAAIKGTNPYDMEVTTSNFNGDNSDNSGFQNLAYFVIGLVSFFFVFIISGMTLVKESIQSTLRRMLATPIKRWQVVGGFLIGFGFLAFLQATVIVLFSHYLLNVHFGSNIVNAIIVMFVFDLAAISLGQFVSTFARNEFQVMQFIPLLLLPQIVLSGIIPLEILPDALAWLAHLCPMYYGSEALYQIMVNGESLLYVTPYLVALIAFSAIIFLINTQLLKRHTSL